MRAGMSGIVPCLWLDDQAEAAAEFYTDLFEGSRVHAVARYPEGQENPSGKPPGSVMTVEFDVDGQRFTALNGGPLFSINPSISFFLFTKDEKETDRLHDTLIEGGSALMPLDAYPWSKRYAWVQDRFGVSWQIMMGDAPGRRVMPCLMFANALHGRAGEAMNLYADALGGRVDLVDRYTAGEGPEGTVKHGRLRVGDQVLAVMDAPGEHAFDFNEGVSLQVMCQDQDAVDRYWSALTAGGEEGPCGWLKDRFGVSWQVVPAGFIELVNIGDPEGLQRAFNAMLQMRKLDLATLQAAYQDTPEATH